MSEPGKDPETRATLWRALRHRNYRLFITGQGVSLIGTWITRVATSWLIYRLTGSAAMLGILGFVGMVPTFLLSPLAGVWVDRLDRRKVLLATQTLAMLQSLTLAALVLSGVVREWHVFALQAFQGVINAFDTPGRQSFVVEMVDDRADLPNAIALNSSMVNAARLIGPSVAGLLIAGVGEGWCFLVDGVSYLAVIASLLAMRLVPRPRPRKETHVLEELRAGFGYALGFLPIRALLGLLALIALAGMPYSVLMPIMADQVLHGGAHALGFLMSASGVGALAGAVFLASRRSVLGLGRLVPAAAGTFGLGLVAFSLSRNLFLSMAILAFVGLGFMVQLAGTNTLLQTMVREEMRGRVMAFYAMAFIGMTPFGSLFAGSVASRIGTPLTLLVGGIVCMSGAALFARNLPRLRAHVVPVYVERGILPQVAAGVGAATDLREES